MAAATQATRLAFHEQSEGRFIVVVLDLRIERVSSHATREREGESKREAVGSLAETPRGIQGIRTGHLWKSTLWIRRMEHRKYNRGRNRLPTLVQTIAPSVLFPVFHPLYPQGTFT